MITIKDNNRVISLMWLIIFSLMLFIGSLDIPDSWISDKFADQEFSADIKESCDSIKTLKRENQLLKNSLVNTIELIAIYEKKISRDSVIFVSGDNLYTTLGIRDPIKAKAFAIKNHFKWYHDQWDKLIVIVPIGTKFVFDWQLTN